MGVRFVKYLRGSETFAEAVLELKGSIQYITKNTFIEIISLQKQLNVTTFVLTGTFSSKIAIQWQHSVPNTKNVFGRH